MFLMTSYATGNSKPRGIFVPLIDLITTKLYMVIIWKAKNKVIRNKTYQFLQYWLSLHSLYSTRDFQVRK